MNFYISDTHFGHKISSSINRPFDSIEEMDEALIERWNEVVGDDDTVYILGDFSWYKEDETLAILDRLAGHKVLVKGNYDRISPNVAKKFDQRCEYLEINDGNERVIMSHYPMSFWNGQFRDTVHLFGHVHNSHQNNYCLSVQRELKQLQNIPMRMYNVGCMMEMMDYTPQTLEFIISWKGGDIDE